MSIGERGTGVEQAEPVSVSAVKKTDGFSTLWHTTIARNANSTQANRIATISAARYTKLSPISSDIDLLKTPST